MCWEAGLSHDILPESLRRMRERQRDYDEAQQATWDARDEQDHYARQPVTFRVVYFDMEGYERREAQREAWRAAAAREADEARARHAESVRQARLARQRADAFLFDIDTEMSATVPLAPRSLQPRDRPMTRQPERWANAGAA